MLQNNIDEIYAEVGTVLSLMEDKYIKKIPIEIRNKFKNMIPKQNIKQINCSKLLAEQNLNKKTLAILAVLNYNYWCESEEEKQKLLLTYKKNQIKHQQELIKKYNPDDLFKNRKKKKNI